MKISPYYPPRAGTLSRCLAMKDRWVVRMRLSQAMLPAVSGIRAVPHGFPWLLVPGLMWRQQGRSTLGNGVLAAWAALVTIHVASLNPDLANHAAALASALHAISAAAVLTALCPHWQGVSRVVRTVLLTSLLMLVIYTMALRNVVLSFAQRITTHGTTVMTHGAGWFSDHPWTQGEWVAYRLPGGLMNMDRILAGPGDTIRFHQDSFEVNGRFFERVSRQMPVDGEKVMDAGTYFIWPTEAAFTHGGDAQPGLLLGLAEIDESALLGRPYRRWFWKLSALEALKPVHSPNP